MNFVLGLGAALLTIGSAMIPNIVPTEVRNIVWLLASIIVIEALTLTNTLVLQKRFRFKALGIVDICCLIVWLTTVCLLVGRNRGFEVLLYAQLAEGCCRCSLLFLTAGLQFTGFAAGKDLQHYYFYQFTRPVIPLIIVQGLLGRVDYLLLSGFSTRSELGVYERLGQFTKIPMSLTINLCDKVLMHSYSHAQNDCSTLKRMVRKSMTIMVVGAVLATAVVSCFLLIFLPRLVGSEWAPRIIRLWWFGIPLLLLTPVLANINLFFSGLGMQFQLLKNSALNLLTDLTLGLLLVGGFGAAGVLMAKSIGNILMFAYQGYAVRKTIASPPAILEMRQIT
jgi:O-antigen/teichoic acid export membrane protein